MLILALDRSLSSIFLFSIITTFLDLPPLEYETNKKNLHLVNYPIKVAREQSSESFVRKVRHFRLSRGSNWQILNVASAGGYGNQRGSIHFSLPYIGMVRNIFVIYGLSIGFISRTVICQRIGNGNFVYIYTENFICDQLYWFVSNLTRRVVCSTIGSEGH